MSGVRAGGSRGGQISVLDDDASRPALRGLSLPCRAHQLRGLVWLYFRFPLSLRMVEEMLAARGISVTYETIRQWGLKFGREFANRIRRRAPAAATSGTSMLNHPLIFIS